MAYFLDFAEQKARKLQINDSFTFLGGGGLGRGETRATEM